MGAGIQLLINGLVAGVSYGLMAVSFALIYNTTHFFHFAHGAIYTFAAYTAFFLITVAHFSAPVAVLGAAIGAAVLGGLMEICVYRPLRVRLGGPIIFLLASLGLLVTLQNCISLIFGDGIKLLSGASVREGFIILNARITPIQLVMLFINLGLYVLVVLGLRYTRAGKRLRAVANNQELACIVGMDSAQTILAAFLIGSSLAGVAAVLVAYDTGLWPVMGFNALLFGVVGMVIGGVGNISGAFLGGLAVGFAQQISAWVLPSKWQDAVVFLILTAFLFLRPQGFLGKHLRKVSV
jgi:branched-chain amino acid transport system permease protein